MPAPTKVLIKQCHRDVLGCTVVTMSFNWRKFEAWRQHPMLINNWRHSMPGFGIGAAAFAVYVVYDQTMGSGSSKKNGHH